MNRYLDAEVSKEDCQHPDFFGHYIDDRPRCGYCGKYLDEEEEEND